jgi:protein-disulfide isomerase
MLPRELGINGTLRFIVGTELVPGALDLNELKDLVAKLQNAK